MRIPQITDHKGNEMQITEHMDIAQLAERMGDTATEAEARAMRELLCKNHDGMDTSDIGEMQWCQYLCYAVNLARAA